MEDINNLPEEFFLTFFEKLLILEPDIIPSLKYINDNPEKIKKFVIRSLKNNPEIFQSEVNRLRDIFQNDNEIQKFCDNLQKFFQDPKKVNDMLSEIIENEHNINKIIQFEGDNSKLNSNKIKQMLKGENKVRFEQDMGNLGIKKDTNSNKEFFQKVNNQKKITPIVNNFFQGSQVGKSTSLPNFQYLDNEDYRLGRGIYDDFRKIKYKTTFIPNYALNNPSLTPNIQNNRIIYNLKDFI